MTGARQSPWRKNEVSTVKAEGLAAGLRAHIAELDDTIKTQDIAAHLKEIEQAQVELQGASLPRKVENLEYQTTVAGQTATAAAQGPDAPV